MNEGEKANITDRAAPRPYGTAFPDFASLVLPPHLSCSPENGNFPSLLHTQRRLDLTGLRLQLLPWLLRLGSCKSK